MDTLQTLIDDHRLGLLKTPNIQIINQKLCGETIQFPRNQLGDSTCTWATFRKAELINMEFNNINFESSCFDECFMKNCVFKDILVADGTIHNSMLENCEFIDCNLNEWSVKKTSFNKCQFLRTSVSNSFFEGCHFMNSKLEFQSNLLGLIGSAVVSDSKFSNSKKSIEVKEKVYFLSIFDQIQELSLG